tara:strand:+ start:3253 stop:3708 length:456 start_codon:yes stop_codon:yes gene_type:complete
MIYQCENNYLDNTKNILLRETLRQKDFPWYLQNKIYLRHDLIIDGNMVSNFSYVLKPYREKIKNDILNASCFLFLKNDAQTIKGEDINKTEDNFFCLLHFINSSDGLVDINNIDKIPYSINRAILFDNNIKITHNTPTNESQFFVEILFKK